MRKQLRLSLALLTLLVISCGETFAATYFVRPYLQGGTYGSGDGSSYGNAWNGMAVFDTKWGNTVGPGDTVYICGKHLNGRPTTGEGWLRPTVSGTENARITISGACPNDSGGIDKGNLYAVHLEVNSSVWTDPDADGVYSQPYGGCTYPFLLEDGTRRLNWIPIDTTQTPPVPTVPYNQWPAGSFTQLGCGGDLYYKPSSGVASGHSIHTAHSVLVIVNGQQYINIQDLRLFASTNASFMLSNADFIRIQNNEFQWGGIQAGDSVTGGLLGDNDDCEVLNNSIHDMLGTGIYLLTQGSNSGYVNTDSNDRWRIAYNEIYNISPGNILPGCEGCVPYPDNGDRHGIGIQGGNGIVIEYNHMHNIGGEGIVIYNWSNNVENGVRIGQNQRENTIRYNYIHDIKDLSPGCQSGQTSCSNQRGIELGSDSYPVIPESSTGNIVHHNILSNVAGTAFRFKSYKPDSGFTWRILNNVVYKAGVAHEFGLCAFNDGGLSRQFVPGHQFTNNIIMDSDSLHVNMASVQNPNNCPLDSSGTERMNNLYFPDTPNGAGNSRFKWENSYNNFAQWQSVSQLDLTSIVGDPLFIDAGNPDPLLRDFHLNPGSPAINAGVNVGLSADKDGNPIGANPDIGAYELQYADLSLTLTDAPDPVLQGDAVTYTITVTNTGPSSATGVTVSGALPSCNLGTIASGASANCTRSVTASSVGTLSQSMSVTAVEYDPATANNTATASTTVNAPVSGGLRGDYYDNPDFTGFVLSRIDPTVNFSWSGSPATGVGADTFSVRWSGKVKPQYSQTYTFYVRSNDGARLWVNGQLLIDNWGPHGTVENSGTIALTAGQLVDVKLEYWDNTSTAVARLSWSSPSRSKQVIPSGRLYH
jgi:uncharacterized repeat protein (TIGR01451 family)